MKISHEEHRGEMVDRKVMIDVQNRGEKMWTEIRYRGKGLLYVII
jgi:hypothetical protein